MKKRLMVTKIWYPDKDKVVWITAVKSKTYNQNACRCFALAEEAVLNYAVYGNGDIFYMTVTNNFSLRDFYSVTEVKKGYYDMTVMKGA